MTESEESVIMRAYTEAKLAAFEKGLSGAKATRTVLAATAKVASRILGREITPEHVERIIARLH